ncbi:MAG: hypothetical protein CMJ46_10540, partial [Planctomyces sp.]|nr:hypothetical protein [Planctomyces sp.]
MISYHEICTLIPTYDLEDFPTDLEESKAESILNCFAVMWHPLLLADARQLPTWRRLESEPAIFEGRLVLVPTACDWISADFAERVLDVGGTVIEGLVTREEWLEAIRTVTAKGEPTLYKRPLRHEHDHDYIHDEGHAPEQSGTDLIIQTLSQLKSEEPSEATEDDPDNANESSAIAEESSEKELPADPLAKLSPEIERDFLALGFAYLQTELLSRQMHHFSSVDEIALRLAVTRAAKSALEGDDIAARMGLNRAFELLHDVREIFFPVESYLIDLCLLTPEADADRLTQICERAKLKPAPSEGEEEGPLPGTGKAHPVNFMLNAKELSELAEKQPAACETLSETWKLGKIDFCGGEQVDRPSMLAPMESVLWNFQEGHATWEGILKQRPKMWSRRRFGFSTLLPMLLNRFGYRSAFHFALDDGLYPDTEHTRFKWEGVDYTPIEACSRIPMAADSAASFLKFPQRLAESMQSDNVAGVILAHQCLSHCSLVR